MPPLSKSPKELLTKNPHIFGDVYVRLPKERILIAGDSHLSNWIQILKKVEKKFKPRIVLPGHGKSGGPEVLRGQIEYFQALKNSTTNKTKLELPAELKPWAGEPLQAQLEDFRTEAKTKLPVGSRKP